MILHTYSREVLGTYLTHPENPRGGTPNYLALRGGVQLENSEEDFPLNTITTLRVDAIAYATNID